MKNPDDYNAGWTTKTYNPKTGKTSSGGAARNTKLAQIGGAEALFNAGGISSLNQVTPLIQQLQGQLATAQLINAEMANQLQKLKSKRNS